MMLATRDYIEELGVLGIGSRFKRISDLLMANVKRLYDLQNVDFEPKWFPLFGYINRNPDTSLTEASLALGVTHSAVSQIAKELEKAGLIEAKRSTVDERQKIVVLTEKGIEYFEKLTPFWDVLKDMLDETVNKSRLGLMDHLESIEKSFRGDHFYNKVAVALKNQEYNSIGIIEYDTNNPEHREKFAELNIEWLEKYFCVEEIDKEIFENPEKRIIEQDGVILFATFDKKIVGTGSLFLNSHGHYEIAKIGVNEAYQGRQIGKKITIKLLEFAQSKGLDKVYLDSNRKLTKAISLYRKLGFVEIETDNNSCYARCDITMMLDLKTF